MPSAGEVCSLYRAFLREGDGMHPTSQSAESHVSFARETEQLCDTTASGNAAIMPAGRKFPNYNVRECAAEASAQLPPLCCT